MLRIRISLAGLLISFCVLEVIGQTGPKDKKNQSTAVESPETFLLVTPKPGENAVELLQRYELYDYPCNISQFFKINKIKEDYRLKQGATYELPIFVVAYNGKSIRTTLEIDDWKLAKKVERYNKDAQMRGLRSDNFVVSKKMWVPWHLINCPDQGEESEAVVVGPRKPAEGPTGEPSLGKGQRVFPIFGKKYEKTPLLSRKLKGRVFYIVSGHGGPDVGAQGKRAGHVLCEDEYAYDVSLRFLRLLISHGATAYMIVRDENDGIRDEDFLPCDKDEVVLGNKEIPLPQRERLQQRTDLINDLTEKNMKAGLDNQTVIEIHVDSRSSDDKTDIFFYYRPESEPSKELALRFYRKFERKYQSIRGARGYSGTVTPRYLFTLRETNTPRAVYIELGNIRNDWDQQRLVLKNNRQAVANWLLESLLSE